MTEENWKDPFAKCFGMLLDGRAQESGLKQRGSDETLLIVTNSHFDVVKFKLPEVPEGRQWVRLLDTNDPKLPRAEHAFGAEYLVTGRSLLLFLLERGGAAAQPHPERKPDKRDVPQKK
jgi:glycogen operon protein